MQERYIEKKVVNWSKKNGWFTRKTQWIGVNGCPDRLFVKDGRTVWIEFKQFKKKPTVIQQREIDRMRDVGCEVWVCDSIDSALSILSKPRPNIFPWEDWL